VSSEYEILRANLSDRPIAFHPMLARVLGGVYEALFFQQIAYWSGRGSDPDWIYKTRDEMQFETTLNRYQQEQARSSLKRLGVLEEERRGLPAKMHYRIVWGRVYELLEVERTSANQLVDGEPTGRRSSAKLSADSEPTSKRTTKTTQREDLSKGTEPEQLIPQRELVMIETFVRDFAQEFRDRAPLVSSVTRATNLYAASGLTVDQFLTVLQEARAVTQKASGGITTETGDGSGRKSKMAFWFRVLEDLISRAA